MADEPESLVVQLLRGVRADIAELKGERSVLKGDMVELKSDMASFRADVASDFILMRADMARLEKETREQVTGLRRAVVEYHSSVIGHGMIISELEARMRRVEQHLNLPALGSH